MHKMNMLKQEATKDVCYLVMCFKKKVTVELSFFEEK